MARKKVVSKRQKVFDLIDTSIDLLQANWKRYALTGSILIAFSCLGYITFYWIDTVESVDLVITYL